MKFERVRQYLLDYASMNHDAYFQSLLRDIIYEAEEAHIYLHQEKAEPFLGRLLVLIEQHHEKQHLTGLHTVVTVLLSQQESKQYQNV